LKTYFWRLLKNLSDTQVMVGRRLRHSFRSVDTIITVVAMPVAIMLMFVYVLGGAVNTGSGTYINYIVPAIILMTISSGVAYTAVGLNMDITSGFFDRFRAMPIAESSILTGHVVKSVVFSSVSCLVVIIVALIMGFRTSAGVGAVLSIIGIFLLYTIATTWMAVMFGLMAKTVEGAGIFAYPLIFLPFISSGFAPTKTMPGPVRVFAENQPVTHIINAVRALLDGRPVGNDILIAAIWCLALLVAAYFASMYIYKNKTV
jgi:ABC-2 type transport system permease protein